MIVKFHDPAAQIKTEGAVIFLFSQKDSLPLTKLLVPLNKADGIWTGKYRRYKAGQVNFLEKSKPTFSIDIENSAFNSTDGTTRKAWAAITTSLPTVSVQSQF